MLTEPFESDQIKKWSQLSDLVKDMYRKVNECMNKPSFAFKLANLLNSAGEQIGVRVYCLGSLNDSTESTLLYCDVCNSETVQFTQQHGPLINEQATFATDQQFNDEEDNLKLPVFKWNELIQIDVTNKDEESSEKLSIEEKLQLERKRMLVTGITSYEFHEQQRRFVFSWEGSLHYFDDNAQAPYLPIKLPSKKRSAKINPSICPSNANLVAYVSDGDLFCLNISTGVELQLTNNKIDEPNKVLTSGLPSYVVQEEFNRYVGFWWQPANAQNPNQFGILFEQVDETDVEVIKIASYDGTAEEYRFPKPGKNNAVSILKIANFKLDVNSNEFYDSNVSFPNNISDLRQMHPDTEYLINCSWLNSDVIVVHLMNRKQQNLYLYLLSVSCAFERQIIHEEINDKWVNFTHVCEFFRKENEEDEPPLQANKELSFIWASQETGFRHLYKISVRLSAFSDGVVENGQPLRSTIFNKTQLTSGSWEVSNEGVWLDCKNNLVYFLGLKDSPLENQLYVISLNNKQETIKKLTTSGYSNSLIIFNSQHNIFLNAQSSISKPPFAFLNVIQNANSQLPIAHRVGYVIINKIVKPDGTLVSCVEQFEMLPGFSRPELFSYQLKESGDIVYGLIYKPDFMQADKKYPCVLEVYGGPHQQMVTNTFRSVRTFNRHMLASQGYVVCLVDCRGSTNRGLAFEAHLHRRMGQVEVQDQVEVLQWLATTTNYIDLNKIAVFGFSYGGYLSLLCYATRPDFFRLAIAGAPVTNWQLYDSAYTERYMDTPENNPDGYAKGSVLNHISNFPNEEHRLLIIHGLKDENVHFTNSVDLIYKLVQSNKPYDLQIYPQERHGLRSLQTRIHVETVILSFLNRNL